MSGSVSGRTRFYSDANYKAESFWLKSGPGLIRIEKAEFAEALADKQPVAPEARQLRPAKILFPQSLGDTETKLQFSVLLWLR